MQRTYCKVTTKAWTIDISKGRVRKYCLNGLTTFVAVVVTLECNLRRNPLDWNLRGDSDDSHAYTKFTAANIKTQWIKHCRNRCRSSPNV